MRNNQYFILLAALVLLSACSSSHRPTYSGHQESTEGVPGFVNGKKVSPHVKLGQSYTVDGETYVPRNQPNYVEEGMASWYGPGFHGGKTANGEKFDSSELTAAHRTLPLPSIVRVTLLSTGKQVVVRVNDRGPFAHSRIIDLSRGAAEKIGLLGVGVGKVRIEYMQKESQRFADLLADGRAPKSIDVASEVLNYRGDAPVNMARADTRSDDAQADEAAPVSEVSSNDLPPPQAAAAVSAVAATDESSPFAAMESAAPEPVADTPAQAPAQKMAALETGGYYAQLGAFSNVSNAERLRAQYSAVEALDLVQKTNSKGQTLYHVRTRGFSNASAGDAIASKLRAAGAQVRLVHE